MQLPSVAYLLLTVLACLARHTYSMTQCVYVARHLAPLTTRWVVFDNPGSVVQIPERGANSLQRTKLTSRISQSSSEAEVYSPTEQHIQFPRKTIILSTCENPAVFFHFVLRIRYP